MAMVRGALEIGFAERVLSWVKDGPAFEIKSHGGPPPSPAQNLCQRTGKGKKKRKEEKKAGYWDKVGVGLDVGSARCQ